MVGQRTTVSMTTNNKAAYFNVMSPGEGGNALYNGSMSSPATSFTATSMRSGDQRIRINRYRNAARRGERSQIRLKVSVTGLAGATATQVEEDASIPGTNYSATGNIPARLSIEALRGIFALAWSAGVVDLVI
ncbi:hypothetical protein [Novosphingobium sp.]|uniref:hypothetical protein n=1 Tax=Novosphingobium sp. TaxID=1874826 RepID=UPI0025FA9919|nr:hypothetical protein [Novosphingobium sp.]